MSSLIGIWVALTCRDLHIGKGNSLSPTAAFICVFAISANLSEFKSCASQNLLLLHTVRFGGDIQQRTNRFHPFNEMANCAHTKFCHSICSLPKDCVISALLVQIFCIYIYTFGHILIHGKTYATSTVFVLLLLLALLFHFLFWLYFFFATPSPRYFIIFL